MENHFTSAVCISAHKIQYSHGSKIQVIKVKIKRNTQKLTRESDFHSTYEKIDYKHGIL